MKWGATKNKTTQITQKYEQFLADTKIYLVNIYYIRNWLKPTFNAFVEVALNRTCIKETWLVPKSPNCIMWFKLTAVDQSLFYPILSPKDVYANLI